jgi:hypothetical protein
VGTRERPGRLRGRDERTERYLCWIQREGRPDERFGPALGVGPQADDRRGEHDHSDGGGSQAMAPGDEQSQVFEHGSVADRPARTRMDGVGDGGRGADDDEQVHGDRARGDHRREPWATCVHPGISSFLDPSYHRT